MHVRLNLSFIVCATYLDPFRQISLGHHPCLFAVLQDVEANTVRLEEHGKTVLVLEKSAGSAEQGGAGTNSK